MTLRGLVHRGSRSESDLQLPGRDVGITLSDVTLRLDKFVESLIKVAMISTRRNHIF